MDEEGEKIIDDLVERGKLSRGRGDLLKSKYQKLKDVLMAVQIREKEALEKKRQLQQRIDTSRKEQSSLENDNRNRQKKIADLQSTLSALEDQHRSLLEQDAQLQSVTTQLRRDQSQLQSIVDGYKEEARAMLRPQILKVTREVEILKDVCSTSKRTFDNLTAEKKETAKYTKKLKDGLRILQDQIEKTELDAKRAYQEPKRQEKQAAIVEAVLSQARDESARKAAFLKTVEQSLASVLEERASNKELLASLRKEQRELEQRGEAIDLSIGGVKREIVQCKTEQSSLTADRNALQLELAQEKESMLSVMEEKERIKKQTQRLFTLIQKLEVNSGLMKTQITSDKGVIVSLQRAIAGIKASRTKHQKEAKEEQDMKEMKFADVVKQMKTRSIQSGDLESKLHENGLAGDELYKVRHECETLRRVRAAEAAQLESVRRTMRDSASALTSANEDVIAKDGIILEYRRRLTTLERQLKEAQSLYRAVKGQRNKFASIHHTTKQMVIEVGERVKILENECSQLKAELATKSQSLVNEQEVTHKMRMERDHVREDENKKTQRLGELQKEVERLRIMASDKAKKVSICERDIASLRDDLLRIAESRNLSGLKVVDRNDEVCVLREKFSLQTEVLHSADEELKSREEEHRILSRKVNEKQRAVDLLRQRSSVLPEMVEEVQVFASKLEVARKETHVLATLAEDPASSTRWRSLEPTVAQAAKETVSELAKQLKLLEKQLNEKKEQLLEKNLILNEITTLGERVQEEAKEIREKIFPQAKKAAGYVSKVGETDRRLLAAVAELSMWQASAASLSQEREELMTKVEEGKSRMEEGLPPTDDCEEEWERKEIRRIEKKQSDMRKIHRAGLPVGFTPEEIEFAPGVVRSRAKPRKDTFKDPSGLPKLFPAAGRPVEKPGYSRAYYYYSDPVPQEIEI
ncbi:hypothetical protein ADUPG1_000336 [Aduncisulcus paluster]|uniref:Cilia- and flagella-associated protein 58 central coiled coil domain-containing protein n=1 Tax=Aduncisulcus paluster TaxID=2918883 RepID=A0ABQ5K5Y0_9EUKA|nr:hypothetical protein ADUPG1_000336 [Aduncisulcus paluster]